MARTKTVHRCTECGWSSPKWVGRCGGCGEWNTLVEELDVRGESPSVGPPSSSPSRIADVIDISASARPTGLPEVDRVLGGGFVPGSVTLVGGEPGIGKSTLLLQLVGATAAAGATAATNLNGEPPLSPAVIQGPAAAVLKSTMIVCPS